MDTTKKGATPPLAAGAPSTSDGSVSGGRLVISGFSAGYGAADVLHCVDLTVEPGRLTVLLGPNGAGKSTLLRCVMGLLKPSAGRIEVDGRRIDGQSSAKVARGGIAMVPEGRRLFGAAPIAANLLVGGRVRG